MKRTFLFVIGILHWLICFWTERLVFCGEIIEHIVSYILVKILLLFVLIGIWQGIYQIIFEKESFARKLFCYSIPYLFLTFSYFSLFIIINDVFCLCRRNCICRNAFTVEKRS